MFPHINSSQIFKIASEFYLSFARERVKRHVISDFLVGTIHVF